MPGCVQTTATRVQVDEGGQRAKLMLIQLITPSAHVISGPQGVGATPPPCCQIERILQLFTLNNVAEEAAWRPRSTGKSLSGRNSTPDPAGGTYSAPKPPPRGGG